MKAPESVMMVMLLIGQLACVAPLLGGSLIVVVSHFSFAHHFLSELTEYSLRTLLFRISYLDPSITPPYPTHTYLYMQEPFPPPPLHPLPTAPPLTFHVPPSSQTAAVIREKARLARFFVYSPHVKPDVLRRSMSPSLEARMAKIGSESD